MLTDPNIVVEKAQDHHALFAALKEQKTTNASLLQENKILKEQVAWFKKQIHDRSSEKSKDEPNAQQGQLFNEIESIAENAPTDDEKITIPAHARKKKGRKKIPQDLPRIDVIYDLPDDQKTCSQDGHPLKRISEVTSEQLDYVPAKMRVLRHIRYKYVCSHCDTPPITASKPPVLLPKSNASASLLAHITTAKYVDGLPLYRQERQFERLGLSLNRSLMAKWMIRIGDHHIQPLINLLNDESRSSKLIHMDETRIQVLRSNKDPSADHWVWVRASGPPKQRVVLFDYDPSRATTVPRRLLDGFNGILVTDGYKPYDSVAREKQLTHAGCWAHARRYFNDAYKISGRKDRTAHEAVKRIGAMYYSDKKIRAGTPTPDLIKEQRQSNLTPLMMSFFDWLETLVNQVIPKSTLGKAIYYALGQKTKLTQCLAQGEIPLDNNLAENAIRPYVIGRKAWLFCDSESGAKASTNIYSLVETAKANGKEPHAYLTHVYEKLPLANTVEDIEALLPWNVDLSQQG